MTTDLQLFWDPDTKTVYKNAGDVAPFAATQEEYEQNFCHGFADAADFEASNSEWLSHSPPGDLSPGDSDFTIAGWINMESVLSYMEICNVYEKTGDHRAYVLDIGGGKPRVWISGDGGKAAQVTSIEWGTALSAGTWYYVQMYHDSVNDKIGVRVDDGDWVTDDHTWGVFAGTTPFNIGRQYDPAAWYYDGRMCGWGFWDAVLASPMLDSIHDLCCGLRYEYLNDDQKTNLVAWWDMQEASGTRADSHGSYDLTDNNTVLQGDGICP